MLSNIGRVYLVGAGKMGMAMATGWVDADLLGKDLTIIDPFAHETVLEFATKFGVTVSRSTPNPAPNIVILAVKPQIIAEVLATLRPILTEETLVISIAAGITLSKLETALQSSRIIRCMPNTPAQIGSGITGAFAGHGVSRENREVAEALLQAAGKVVWLENETDLDAVTAVSGSGPAYVFNLVEAMAAAGVEQGLPEQTAMELARQTVIGAALLMAADPTDAAQLRKNVTSPNGTTQAALDVLMASDGLALLMSKAINAARLRSEELGK